MSSQGNKEVLGDTPKPPAGRPLHPLARDPVIWAIVVLAFLIRVFYNLALHADGHPPSSFVIDEREYFGAAHVLAEGRGFAFFDTALWVRPPLYVALLAVPVRFFGASALPVVLAQSILSALSLLPLAWLAYRLGGSRAARIAAGLGALYLPFTLFAGLLLSETLFVFLFGLLLVALVVAQEALAGGRFALGLRWAGAAGALLGLCALTRSTSLGFAPLAAGWLFFTSRREVGVGRAVGAAGVALAVCGLALAPWAARNYRAYGRLVPVDTTGGYNLWLGSVGVRDEERLQADLRAIPNPADRQSFAYARAWENIAADPGLFVRKGLKESLDLWRPLFSAEERQVRGYVPGRVPAWHLLALLVFDDFLYLLILLVSVLGLFLVGGRGWGVGDRVYPRPDPPFRSLTVLWVLLWVAMSFVFFAVTRFRLPVVAALLPWAGAGAGLLFPLAELRARVRAVPVAARAGMGALLVAAILLVVPAISLPDVALGVERWGQQAAYRRAEAYLRERQPREAAEWYRQANLSVADTRYGLAAALLQVGDTPGALAQLTGTESPDRFEPAIIKGEAARRAGNLDAAKAFFNERVVRSAGDEALRWAWDHLDRPVVDKLEVGSGLDVGYIRGFYSPEVDSNGVPFRWTAEEAEVRNLASNGTGELSVRWSGWRVAGLPAATVTTGAGASAGAGSDGGQARFTLDNNTGWQTAELPADADAESGQSMSVRLAANPFVPGGSDPRLLGVRVSQVASKR